MTAWKNETLTCHHGEPQNKGKQRCWDSEVLVASCYDNTGVGQKKVTSICLNNYTINFIPCLQWAEEGRCVAFWQNWAILTPDKPNYKLWNIPSTYSLQRSDTTDLHFPHSTACWYFGTLMAPKDCPHSPARRHYHRLEQLRKTA